MSTDIVVGILLHHPKEEMRLFKAPARGRSLLLCVPLGGVEQRSRTEVEQVAFGRCLTPKLGLTSSSREFLGDIGAADAKVSRFLRRVASHQVGKFLRDSLYLLAGGARRVSIFPLKSSRDWQQKWWVHCHAHIRLLLRSVLQSFVGAHAFCIAKSSHVQVECVAATGV